MSIQEAGAAFRTWAARHGLAPTVAAAQAAELAGGDAYIDQIEQL